MVPEAPSPKIPMLFHAMSTYPLTFPQPFRGEYRALFPVSSPFILFSSPALEGELRTSQRLLPDFMMVLRDSPLLRGEGHTSEGGPIAVWHVGWSSGCPSHSVLFVGIRGSHFPGLGLCPPAHPKTDSGVVGLPLVADPIGWCSHPPGWSNPHDLCYPPATGGTGSSAGWRARGSRICLEFLKTWAAGLTSFFSLMAPTQSAGWGRSCQMETRRSGCGSLRMGPPNQRASPLICLSHCGQVCCHFQPKAFLSGTPPAPVIQGATGEDRSGRRRG